MVKTCEPGKCQFKKEDLPIFKQEECNGLSTSEVREKFPRKWLNCTKCHQPTLHYASFEHYIYGDW